MKAVEGWKTCRLGDLAVVQGGFAFKSNDFDDGGIPIIRMSDLDDGHLDLTGSVRIKSNQLKALSKFALHTGDFLVGMSGSIGNYAIVRKQDLPAYLNQRVGRFLLSDESSADYDFITQIARSNLYKLHIEMLAAGAAQVNISPSQIESFSFDLPPKPEQTKIAEVFSTVDRAIEQTEALIAKQQRIKTGLMQDLLTHGIDEHGNLRTEQTHQFKDSPLGRIPVEWEVVTVEQLGNIVTGSTPSTSVSSYYDGDIMFISPKDVSHVTDLITETEKRLSKKGLSVCRVIPNNSICTVCIGSTIGKIGITVATCATNQQINTLVPYEEKDAEMLYFSMKLFLPAQLRREAGLQAVPIVNKALFSKMRLPLPVGPEERERIRTVLASLSRQIAVQSKVFAKLRSLKAALMQDLLTGKKRVTTLLNDTEVPAS